MTCDVCGLPDPYNGQGDGIGSYADPDLRTTPAGTYRHPRQYATVTPGPPPPRPPITGDRLRAWRRDAHLTQRQVAAATGYRPGQISRWERGLDPVPPALLARLGIAGRTYRP